jgi:hypothetical protein
LQPQPEAPQSVTRDRLLGLLAELEQKEATRLRDRVGGSGNGSASVTSVGTVGSKGARKTSKAASAAATVAATDENAALASLLSRQARRITEHLAAAENINSLYREIDGGDNDFE